MGEGLKAASQIEHEGDPDRSHVTKRGSGETPDASTIHGMKCKTPSGLQTAKEPVKGDRYVDLGVIPLEGPNPSHPARVGLWVPLPIHQEAPRCMGAFSFDTGRQAIYSYT